MRDTAETSPMNTVVEELNTLQADFHSALQIYSARIDSELEIVRAAVRAQDPTTVSPTKMRDLRDMITLLRKFQIKPEKGRRKDLKKIDSLIGDLTLLIESW